MTRKRPKQRAAAGVLGKAITRRSRGRCELCESRDEPRLYELAPFPDEPDLDRTLLLCVRCRSWLEDEPVDPVRAHFLSSAVWSDLPPVKLAAARMLLACDFQDDHWVADALEASNVDPASGEFRVDAVD
jgi:hypothetical protein